MNILYKYGKLFNIAIILHFQSYVLKTLSSLVESVGFEETQQDKYLTKLNRVRATDWACALGDSACANKTREKLVGWLENSSKNVYVKYQPFMRLHQLNTKFNVEINYYSISPDLKVVTLCRGLQTAGFDIWKVGLDKCIKTNNTDDKELLIKSLGCSANKKILQFYLNYTLDIHSSLNDTLRIAKIVTDASEIGVDAALNFVIEQFPVIAGKL